MKPSLLRFFLTLFLGVLSGFAFAPYHYVFLLIVGFSGFVEILRRDSRGFILGWVFGFGYYISNIWWIQNAFIVVGLGFFAFLPLVILPACLGVFVGCVGWAVKRWQTTPVHTTLLFAVGWSAHEWIVGHYFFTGFPWVLTGYIWDLPLLQTTAWWGIYGLSFLTTLGAVMPTSHRWGAVASMWGALGIVWMVGDYRLHTHPTLFTNIYIRLVQPAIPQDEKWNRELLRRNFKTCVDLSVQPAQHPLSAIIWPESAIPFFISAGHEVIPILQGIVPKNGLLLFGAPRREVDGTIRVSLLILNQQGHFLEPYDKAHLVPFGEYIPLRTLLPKTPKLTHGYQDFTAGKGLSCLTLASLPAFSPLICYEVIFPGEVVCATTRPAWLLNITNDAWYGISPGPYQHLAIARVRAIEEGLPLVRSTNTGISALVDSLGRYCHRLELEEKGVLDFFLPHPLKPTPFSKTRQLFYFLFMLVSILSVLRKQREEK